MSSSLSVDNAMQHQEGTGTIAKFKASDGYEFHYRHYPPQSRPRGQVVAIHGIQSHGGWYTNSCEHLARAGWEVFFLDRRGSGLNEQARGDTPNYHRLLADIDEFIDTNCPQKPFLMGISWGGKLAVTLEHLKPGTLAGMVLLTPGFCPRIYPTRLQRLAIGVTRFIVPRCRFPIPLDHPELFTSTPEWKEFIDNDAFSLRKATARFLVESARLDRMLKRAHASIRIPVLLLLAERDRIIDNGRTKAYVELFPTYDCRVVEYPGASHTLEFEPDPRPTFRDIERWLETHRAMAKV